MNMKLSFRWYGESDPISLQYISQIPGMRSIVSAVYDVKPGEVWPEESLAAMEAPALAVPFAFFLYLCPLCDWLSWRKRERKKQELT